MEFLAMVMRMRSSTSLQQALPKGPRTLTVACTCWSCAHAPLRTAVGSAYKYVPALTGPVPKERPGVVWTLAQPRPVAPPLVHDPPSLIGFSVSGKVLE